MLAGVSIGAASLVLAASPLRAQAVNGTPTPQFGIGGISRSTPGLDAVFVTGSEALVDWTASDSGGVFLPEGNTLRFIYDGSTPYTVLNRVTDTAAGGPLSISGTVESSSLGKVWFYNAGGWVVGPKGVFNVGSLVLTSLPIAVDPATDTVSRLYGDKNEIRFGTAFDPKSSVIIQSGAQINASLANSSYVAVVAPRVEQAGTVAVNGSAAYVAAEAATLTINSGLFDIIVDSGSDDLEGVIHTGTTKWPSNASSTDASHRIYLVAVPKNQAMTAVVSGSLGYDGATSASVVDGSIVLSAGYNVIGGDVVSTNPVGGDASVAIRGLTVGQKGATTNLTGFATGNVVIDARGSSTFVRGSADLVAQGNISATIDKTNALLVDSNLSLGSLDGAKAGAVLVSVAGGGSLGVGGTLDLHSVATGAIQTDPLNGDALLTASVGEDAVSGNVGLTVTDANFSLGSATLTSIAISGVGELSAGSATSGSVSVNIVQTAGATSTFGGSLGDVSLYTNAANGTFGPQSPISGGNVVSGAATLAVNGGTFDTTSITLGSDALTYAGSEPRPLDATAGAVTLSFANANGTFFTGGISAGNLASASDGGIAMLGDVSLSYDNVRSATSDSFGSIDLQSYAFGNLVTPNTVSLSLSGGSSLETYDSVVSLFAQGRNSTGPQLAANVAFLADASSLNALRLDMTSQALGAGSGSDAVGGNVSAIVRNGANVTLGDVASLRSTARGGSGPDGGNGTGGDVSFTLADSSFTGDLNLSSNGVAGQRSDAAGRSGIGQGGKVSFSQTGKAASFLGNTVTLDSLGQGGRPAISTRTGLVAQAGDGAAGVGGDASFSVAEGTFRASSLTVGANGEGGNAQNVAGFAPGTGGSGSGGSAALSVTGGLMTVNTVDVTASGFGGDGAQSSDALGIVGGIGGAGSGGSATVNLTGGTLQTQGLTIEANGNKSQFDGFSFSYFGNGGSDFLGTGAGGAGGVGTGGNALLTVDGGTLGEMVLSSAGLPVTITVNAIGEGGAGGYAFTMASGPGNRSGDGGNGQGGTAGIRHLSGTLDALTIGIDATGLGGLPGNDAGTVGEFALNAGKGGDGVGGTSTFEIATDFASTTLSGSTRSVDVRADGIGQAGESGLIGGAGGSGTGGTARVLATGGNSTLSAPVLSAEGMGQAGGNSTDGYRGGAGGSGTGGQALVTVIGDGTRLSVDNASLLVSGNGGVGGRGGAGSDLVDEAGDGGDGGAGIGGTIGLVASNLGQLSITGTAGTSFAANGTGGKGGLGGNSAFNGWRTLGDGGDGGIGRGGTFDALAESGGTVTFDDLTLTLNGQGGAGGSYVSLDVSGTFEQSVGGAGGAGFGGAFNLQAVGADSRLEAPSLVASANGRGGAGVDGFGYAADGSSASGSAGGSATGGDISILADASGVIALATGDGNVALSANALGGNGGRAFTAITAPTGIGGNGGNGGDSGAGTGGTIAIAASDSGNASLGLLGTVTLSANGTGGLAGLGGDGANSTAPVTLGGSGGNNGLANSGRGGSISVGASGATTRFGALAVNATGETFDRPFAGAGGSGTSGLGLPGSSAFVTPSGGTVSFASADLGASTGSLVAGDTNVDVTSRRTFPLSSGAFIQELGGAISLTSSSTAATDAMRFASFTGNASGGGAGFSDPAVSLTALSGAIAFDGDLTLLSAGAIALSVGDGLAVAAGGAARLVSDTGIDITATGTGRFSANSIRLETFGSVGITSSSCATATCRPIEAATSLVIDAQGNFAISGPAVVAGLGSLDVYAFGNVTGSANSGYFSNGSLRVRAGNDATIRNASGGSLDLEAGAIPDGATLYYDGLLTLGEAAGGGVFNATGEIILASGGGIAVTSGNSFSAGGGIDVRSGNDIVVGQNNSFTANTSATVPGLPVTFAAGDLTLQYSLAPTDIAALSFGSGTTVSAGTGTIAISGAAIDARLASFTGASFRADVLQTLGLTSPRRNNGERLDPACLEGAICIGNVDVTGTVRIGNTDTVPLDIRAVGRIAGTDVRLLATGNVTLEGVGRVSQIAATGNLSIRSVSREIALLGGALVEGGTVRLAAATNISGTGNVTAKVDDIGLFAGGDIDAASLTAVRELTTDLAAGGVAEGAFSTTGALRVGTLTLGANANITAGKSIEIGTLALGGFSGTLKAGTLLDLGSTAEVQDLFLTAATTVRFTAPAVDGNLAISAQSITGTSAQAGGTLSITSDDLTVDQLQSAGDLTLTIANFAALGSVSSTGGAVFIDPVTLTFDAITSANAINLAGGTITGGTLDAGTSIDVNASGALTLASTKAGTTLSLVADSLQSGALDAGGNLSLTVAKGAALTGAATAAGDITASFGTLDFTTLGATGLVSLEGKDLSGTGITSGTSLTALLSGDYAVTSAQGGTSLALQAATATANSLSAGANLDATVTGLADLAAVSATGDLTLTAGSLLSTAITAGGLVDIGVSANASVDLASSGTILTVDVGTLVAGDLVAGTVLSLKAATTASITGKAEAGTDASINATSLVGGSFIANRDLGITANGDASFVDASAGGTLTVSSADLAFNSLAGKTVGVTAANVLGNQIALTDALTINATGNVTLALIGPTPGTVDIKAANLSLDLIGSGDLGVDVSGNARLGAVLGSGAVNLSADNLLVDNLSAVGAVSLSGTSIDAGTILAESDLGITGTGDVAIDRAAAGGTLNITAAGLAANTLGAAGDLTLQVANTAALGTVTSSGGSIAIDPALLTFDSVTASGDITLIGGTISGGTLDAGASIGVTATDALSLTSARSGTTLSLTAASVQAGGLDAGTDLELATTADITLTDIANAGGAVRATFSTFEFVGLNAGGLLDLAGTDLVGTNLGGTSISAGADASIALTGRYAVTALTGGRNLVLGAQTASGAAIDVIGNADVSLAGLTSVSTYFAGGTLSLSAGELSALALSGGNVDARIAGAATLDSGDAGANFALSAASLDAGTFRTGGDLSLSTTGSLAISGDVNAGGNLAIVAGDLDAFSLAADGGIDLNVSNNANVDFAVAGQLLNVVAGGLSLQSLSAADIAVDSGSVSGGGISAADSLSIISAGLVDLGTALAGGALAITSRNLTALTVQSRGGNVSLSVGALANLGDVSALAGDISATAGRLGFVSASANGQVQLGGVVIGGGVVNAGTSALVSATNSMLVDTITAGAGVDLNGGDIDINAVNAGTFADYAGRDVRVGTTTAGTFVAIVARNFAFDALSATDSVGIGTSLGIVGGTIDAGTTLDIDATGVVSLDVAKSGGALHARFFSLDFNLLDAGGQLDLAGTDLTGTNMVTGGNALIALTGSYAVGSITGGGTLAMTANSASSTSIAFDGNVSLTVADTAALGTVTSNTGAVTIDPALLTFDAISAAGDIALSGGTITGGRLDAGAAIGVAASGALTLASAKAGTNLTLGADSLQSGALDAIGNIRLTVAKSAALTGVATTGGDFSSTAGSLDFTTINAGAAAIFGGGSINGAVVDAKGAVSASLSGSTALDTVTSGTTLGIGADTISAKTLNAGTGLSLFANTTITIGTATASGDASLNAASIRFDSVSSTGLAAIAGGTVTGGTLTGTGGVDIAVTGAVRLTSATSGAGLAIDAANLAATSLTAAGDARLTATGNLDLGTTQAGGSLSAQGLDLSFLSLTGQTVELAGRAITGGTIDARSTLLVQSDGLVRLHRARAGSTAEFYVGSLDLPDLGAVDIALGVRGAAKLGTVEAAGMASLSANSLEFSAITAGGPASLSAGSITGGTVFSRFGVSLISDGAIAITSARAFGPLNVRGASVTADSLSSDDSLTVQTTGDIAVGALYGAFGASAKGSQITFNTIGSDAAIGLTGTTINGGRVDTAGSVGISATGNVTLAAVDAGFDVEITANALDLPSLQAGRDVRLAITDVAALGAVTSTGGSVTIDPVLLTFSTITSANAISLAGGTITGGTLDAGTSIDVNATGNLGLDLADAGTTLSLVGANVEVGSLLSVGSSSVSAQDLVRITSAINSGGDISVTASRFTTPLLQSNSGNISLTITGRADLTDIIAFGGDLTIDAGTLRFTSAGALGAVRLGGADIAGTTVTSGTSTNITTGNVANIGTVTAGSSVTLGGPNVTVAKVTAGTFTDFDGRSINVGETTAGTTALIDARDFTFSKFTAGESVEILSSGNTTGGTIDAGTTLRISARGDARFDDAKAGGTITIGAANINALTINGDAGLSLTATNAIDLGTVKVLGAFDLSGASLVLGSSSSGLDSTFRLTGNATIGNVAAGLASTGQNLVQIVVQALGNSYTGGTLVPVFDVVQGQTITVSSSTNDLWSAGFLPRFSDGDGLIAFRLATAQDDSGVQPGTQIGAAFGNLTIGNFSAPFGALVGQIGNQNVLIGANGTVTAPATGTLSVGYWDSNAGDNTGSIAFTFGNGTGGGGASNPANVSITTGGNLTVGSANATSAISLDAAGALKLDSADAGTALSLTGNTIDAGTLKAGTDITFASTGGSTIGSATAGGRFSADIGALDFTLIDAAGAVDIASLAGVRGDDIRSGARIVVDASGSITIRDADAASDLALKSGAVGDITARTLAAGGSIGIEGRDVSLGSATATGSFTVSGTGAVELGTATAGNALRVNSQTLTFTRMSSGGTLVVGTSGDVIGGDLVATGTMRINTGTGRFAYGTLDGGDIAIMAGSASGGGIRVRGGDLNLGVTGDATVGAINASGNVAIDAQRLVFSTISAGGAFGTTNRSMTGTSISVGDDVSISSQGDIALAGLTGASAQIRSAGIVNITGLQLSGAISVSADAVGLDARGDLAIRTIAADRGNVDVTAEGSITGNTINALGDINLLARNGDVVISHLSAGYSNVFGGSVRPQGTVTSGAIGQGNIDIVANGDIVINDVADAAKAFTMNAGNTIRINGLATGATMDLTSADLEIGASGRLGEAAHTDAITLRNTGQGPLRLGDNIASTVSGYAISQAEFARIRSRGDLTIRANQALLVGDLAVVAQAGLAQGQIGENGTLSLRSGSLASFLGALSMSNAGGNTLAINSQSGVFLDAATGTIRLLEGTVGGGTLAISGTGIAMVTRSALDDISQLTDTALITDRLGLNDGVADGRTLVEADTIQLRSDRDVYIQNTSLGTRLDDRRGLVARALRIGSRDGSQLDIVINGIVNGQVGVDAIEQITFEEAFTDLSSVNGCVIVNANTCNKLPFEIIELRDLVEEVLKSDPEDSALQVTDSFTKTTLIQLNQIAPAGFEPLIDEPVTGTGNDDLLGEGKQDGE